MNPLNPAARSERCAIRYRVKGQGWGTCVGHVARRCSAADEDMKTGGFWTQKVGNRNNAPGLYEENISNFSFFLMCPRCWQVNNMFFYRDQSRVRQQARPTDADARTGRESVKIVFFNPKDAEDNIHILVCVYCKCKNVSCRT